MNSEPIRDTYNTFFRIFQGNQLTGCDAKLSGILAAYALSEPDFLQVLNVTYEFYKHFRDRNPATDDFWNDIIKESGTLYEMTGENQMVEDVLLFLVSHFEEQARDLRRKNQ